MEVLLLAERLRVEERLLIDALAAAGCDARLVTPEEIGVLDLGGNALTPRAPLPHASAALRRGRGGDSRNEPPLSPLSPRSSGRGAGGEGSSLVISRLLPTREATALAWALEGAGMSVVNTPQAHDLISRRDWLMRSLLACGIATPPATLAWGQAALLEAADQYGWPVELLPLEGGRPGIVVEDREAAEAVIEHRAVLGSEHVMLVRAAVPEHEQRRLLVAGTFVQAARFQDGGWVVNETTAADRHLACAVTQASGGQLLDVLYLPGEEPAVTFVAPLNGFRDLQSVEVDIAGAVAACLSGIGAAYV